MLFKLRGFGEFFFFRRLFGLILLVGLSTTQTVYSSGNVTLLEFTSPNCPTCRRIEPLVQQLIAKGYPIRQVNADAESQLAEQLGVKSLPTFVVWADGRVVDRIEGVADGFVLERRLSLAFEKGHEANAKPNSSPFERNVENLQQMPHSQTLPVFVNPVRPVVPTPATIPWLQATVRLRVESPDGHDWGTGTIIDARGGEVLILTCGHIFRDSQGKGRIEVDLYCGNTPKRVPGVCLKYDADRLDLGLVKIAPQFDVDVIPIAPPGTELRDGMPLISTGCDNGSNPTIRQHRVRSLGNVAPFVGAPFHYIQVDNAPVQGRSGGGIFTENGYLVGVCVAGNNDENEGLFVPVSVIRNELDKAGLSCVYQSPSITRSQTAPILLASAEIPSNAVQNNAQTQSQQHVAANTTPITQPVFHPATDNAVIVQPGFAINQPAAGPIANNMAQTSYQHEVAAPAPLVLKQPPYRETGLNDREIATLEELRRRQSEGDEIIVIVRSKRKPDQPCEVIQLSDISTTFLEELANPNASFTAAAR